MKQSVALVITVVLMSVLCTAEDKLPMKAVRVIGTAEVKVVPDRAIVQLGVQKQSVSASAAKQAEDAAARRILAELEANGVAEKDIQTTFLSLQPQTTYHKGVRNTFFVAEQTMSVTVRDLSKLDMLLERLIKSGGNQIDSIQYETSDLRKYRDDARDGAVKAAREKAQALAMALGQQIGKAQMIEEVAEPGGYSPLSNVSYEYSRTPMKARSATAAGETIVSASVIVSFDLD